MVGLASRTLVQSAQPKLSTHHSAFPQAAVHGLGLVYFHGTIFQVVQDGHVPDASVLDVGLGHHVLGVGEEPAHLLVVLDPEMNLDDD